MWQNASSVEHRLENNSKQVLAAQDLTAEGHRYIFRLFSKMRLSFTPEKETEIYASFRELPEAFCFNLF